MLRPRSPQQLGYVTPFGQSLWSGVKQVVTTPYKLAKDIVTLNPCGLIRDAIPLDVARDIVKRVGCNPAGRAALDAVPMAFAGPAGKIAATIGDAAFQMCICNWVDPSKYPAPALNQFPPGYQQQLAAQQQPFYTKPIFLLGIAAAVAGLILSKKKSSSSTAAAAPTQAPVVVNVQSPKDEED